VNTWAKAPRAMRCLSSYMLLSNKNLQTTTTTALLASQMQLHGMDLLLGPVAAKCIQSELWLMSLGTTSNVSLL